MKGKTFVIDLGGSIIFPEPGVVNISYLKKFKQLIINELKKKNKFIIVVGGGKTARVYQDALKEFSKNTKSLDWIGINSTWLNASLLQKIFSDLGAVLSQGLSYSKKEKFKTLLIAGGYLPGTSTDFGSVEFAKKYKIKTIINLSNIDGVYSDDPKKNKKAKKFEKLNWKDYQKLFSNNKWTPGMNRPFDPIASKLAQKARLKVYFVGYNNGNLSELKKIFENKPFSGTILG